MLATLLICRMDLNASIDIKEIQNDGSSDNNKMVSELWELIASKMTPKEWARARRACPAMHKAKVKVVRARPHNSNQLAKAAGDVPNAKTLWLDLTALRTSGCSTALFKKLWGQEVDSLEHLQQLSLTLSAMPAKKSPEAPFCWPAKPSESVSKWLEALAEPLASARNLEVLRLDVANMNALPPMEKLQHLNLISWMPLSEATCQWLQKLPSLRTLSLEQSPAADMPAAYMVPPLDLSACKHLQSVSLFHIIPSDFQAPRQCSVTLWTDHVSLQPSWADTYSTSATACSVLVPAREFVNPTFFVDMFAPPAAHLTALRIEVPEDMLGVLKEPLVLGDNMPNLRAFRCRAWDIFLKLGGQLRLQSLRCDAKKAVHLEIEEEDLDGAVSELQHLDLFWAAKSVHSPLLRRQLIALQKTGRRCSVEAEQEPLGSYWGSFQGSRQGSRFRASFHADAQREDAKLCMGCGACGMCLQEKHGIPGLFGPP